LLARADHFRPDRALAGRALRVLAAAGVMALALLLLAPMVAPAAALATPLAAIWRVGLLIAVGLGVYGLGGLGIGAFDLDLLREGLAARRLRKAARSP
jgi:hypothetical protein